MYKQHSDTILEGDNVIIGLGDSFTQGVGAYSLETWASIPNNPSTYNISGQGFLEEQAKNNWVSQIKDNFLPNYKAYNLGVNGGGNRATARELYLNPLPKNLGNVVVILMATSMERFDFLKQKDETAGINWHQKWQTIWPTISDRGPISILEKEYLEQIWSKRNDALEFLFTVREIENFCKANGFHFLFASTFDLLINKNKIKILLADKSEHIDIVNWDNFIDIKNAISFMDMIDKMETKPEIQKINQLRKFSVFSNTLQKEKTVHDIQQVVSKLKMPTKYITPCCHWTIEGQYEVAKYLHTELIERKLI
jgi:hypothetical protein